MSATTPTPAVPTTPALQVTAEQVDSFKDLLTFAATMVFPGAAAGIKIADAALEALIPYVVAIFVNKKKFTLDDLKAMQVELNSLGGSFADVGGYTNVYAGGKTPAPGTVAASAPPASATLNIKGVTVQVSAATFGELVGFIQTLTSK